ncbi:Neurabin-1, partial [Dissostichus eleginoides]
MILSSKKLPELWDYFLIYVSGALEFNPDCNDVDLGMFPLRMNPTIKTRIMPRRDRIRKEKQRELQQAARGSSSLLSWVKQPEPTSKEDEDADVPDEPLPIINDEDEEERTLMGPYGVDRAVHSMEFTDCENGLGIKVIGGVKEQTGEEFGVYVKRILPGGVASYDGNLLPGDQILEVNGDSLVGVTSDRAVDVLRAASATNHMRLLIARDEEA